MFSSYKIGYPDLIKKERELISEQPVGWPIISKKEIFCSYYPENYLPNFKIVYSVWTAEILKILLHVPKVKGAVCVGLLEMLKI